MSDPFETPFKCAFLAAFVLGLALIAVGARLIGIFEELNKTQAEAVQKGYAEYSVDTISNTPKWRWKEKAQP